MKTTLFLLFLPICLFSQHRLYLIAGMGGDERSFAKLETPDTVEAAYLPFLEIKKNESLPDYAKRMAKGVDTSESYSFLGVSFGGMVAIEMEKVLSPKYIFLISSAKVRSELPFRYRFQKFVPLYKLLGGGFMKKTAPLAARIFEPKAGKDRALFKEMVQVKSNAFVKHSFGCIARWENTEMLPNVVHFHGNKDHTLPIRRIKNAEIIRGGTHWMILFEAAEVSNRVGAYFEKSI